MLRIPKSLNSEFDDFLLRGGYLGMSDQVANNSIVAEL